MFFCYNKIVFMISSCLRTYFSQNKKNIFTILALFLCAGFFVFFPDPILAQIDGGNLETLGQELQVQESIGVIIARIIRAFLGILGIIAVLLTIYGGFLFLLAAGDPVKAKKGQDVLKNSLIGLVIIFSSYSIASFILSRLLEAAVGGTVTTQATQYSEPLSGSLGSGAIESHYPERYAIDIPRNTNIMVTFKQAVDPASVIEGYSEETPDATNLNTTSVQIYPTEEGDGASLLPEEVAVALSEDQKTVVFDPLPLLGNSETDTNYTVSLTSSIKNTDGESLFADSSDDGYVWTFEVSTEVDLSPPYVVSVVPEPSDDPYDRNITIQLTFNEAMNPVAATGTYDPAEGKSFVNIETLANEENVYGTYTIGNNYKTIEFVTQDACGKDPCGDTIYCLPSLSEIDVQAHAAEVGEDAPQAILYGASYNGLVDASGNSLDGNKDDVAVGSPTDDYEWNFSTSSETDDTVPEITDIGPFIQEGEVDLDKKIEVTFNVVMQSSSLTSNHIKLVPNHDQDLWYSLQYETIENEQEGGNDWTYLQMSHASLWESTGETLYYYYPVITNEVKSAYQICMYPSRGPEIDEVGNCATSSAPYCCNGRASTTACTTLGGQTLY